MQGYHLGLLTDHFGYIYVGVRRGGVAIECSVPAHVFCVSRKIAALKDQLSPAVEDGEGLDIEDIGSAWVEIIVDTVAIW